jgi:dihydropteroate synthase
MGIVNVTPDSFSDGSAFFTDGAFDAESAIRHGLRLIADGADIVDVGGESTRPGAGAVSVELELERVIPVIAGLAAEGAIVSVDTSKPEVAVAAVNAGAEIINDVTAFRDPAMAAVCVESGAGVVLMHMQGEPRTMQDDPRYSDVVSEVAGFLGARAAAAVAAGVDRSRICLDPGIGFGKGFEHNLHLLAGLGALVAVGHPVLVGVSRKRVLGRILDDAGYPAAPEDRDAATAATTALAIAAGAAAVRVHDVGTTLQVARTADAIVRCSRRRSGTIGAEQAE